MAALLAAVGLLGLVIAGRCRGRAATFLAAMALGAAAAAAACVAVAVHAPDRQPERLTLAAAVPGVAEVELTADPRSASGPLQRTMVRGDLLTLRSARGTIAVRSPVLLFVDGAPGQAALRGGIGARITARVDLRPTAPGEDVAYVGSAARLRQVAGAPPALAWAGALRARFAEAASALPGDGGDLLPGLAIGDDGGVDPGLARDMRASSLTHLTAVSGANCAIVVAAVLFVGRRLRRLARLSLAAAGLLAFVVLVTPQPSVLRAAAMALLVLVASARGRPGGGLPTLAAAVAGLLVIDPWLGREAGFALSTLATAGLLVLAGPAAVLLARAMPFPLAAALAVPACAQLACQPVLLLLDPSISLWAVPANLLAAPAAPLATLAGLLSCLALPVAPALGSLLAWIGWAPAAWIAAVARYFAGQEAGRMPWPEGLGGLLILAAVTVALALALLHRRAWFLAGPAVLVVGVVVAVAAGAGLGRAAAMPDWQIASCDVGQGDASILRGGSRFALIDTGKDEHALADCLHRLGISRIAVLVLTHFDLDHIGAAPSLAGRVDTVLSGPSDGPDADRITDALAAGGAEVRRAAAGDSGRLGPLTWRVLWPRAGVGLTPGNDASVIIEASGAGLRSVFLGDLGEEAQAALLRQESPGRVDVVKVAHHGSGDQSAALYHRLAARIALVSCGAGNRYGHPTGRLLGFLHDEGTLPLRTDLEGMLLVAPGPSGVRVWIERSPDRDPATTVGRHG